MKKISYLIFTIFVSILMIPFVFAESISIKSIDLLEKSETATVKSEPTFSGLEINYDLSFENLNDYVQYKIAIENSTDKDYSINMNDKISNYVSLEYSPDQVINANKVTDVTITIKYSNLIDLSVIPDGEETYKEAKVVVLEIKDKEGTDVVNPYTGVSNKLIILIPLLIVSTVSIFLLNKRKTVLVIIICLLLIPVSIYAVDGLNLSVNLNIEIKKPQLPETYDLRDKIDIDVKSQFGGTCGGHAAVTSIETYIAKHFKDSNGKPLKRVYSPYHFLLFGEWSEYSKIFSKYFYKGLGPTVSNDYWSGEKLFELQYKAIRGEELDRYEHLIYTEFSGNGTLTEEEINELKELMLEKTPTPEFVVKSYKSWTGAEGRETISKEIKESIIKYGSVNTSVHMDFTIASDGDYVLYHNTPQETDHSISIIGWDDNYPKEKFPNNPTHDGAWLIINSWGENFGKNGTFWVSYDESTIYSGASVITSIEKASELKKIDLSSDDLTVYIFNKDYTGQSVIPSIVILMDAHGEIELTESQDYEITDTHNIDDNKVSVTIKGNGIFEGTYTGTVQ